MFAKFAVAISALAVLTSAAPQGTTQVSQCNTGPVQCCNSIQSAKSAAVAVTAAATAAGILKPVLAALQGVTAQVGVQCLNIAGDSCGPAQPVCCQNNKFNGLVNIGCTPISL